MNYAPTASDHLYRGRVFEAYDNAGTRSLRVLPTPLDHRVLAACSATPEVIIAIAHVDADGSFRIALPPETHNDPLMLWVQLPDGSNAPGLPLQIAPIAQRAPFMFSMVVDHAAGLPATQRLLTGELVRHDESPLGSAGGATVEVRVGVPSFGGGSVDVGVSATVDDFGRFELQIPLDASGLHTHALDMAVHVDSATEPSIQLRLGQQLGEATHIRVRATGSGLPGDNEFARLTRVDGGNLEQLYDDATGVTWDAQDRRTLSRMTNIPLDVVSAYVLARHIHAKFTTFTMTTPEAIFGALRSDIPLAPIRHAHAPASEWSTAIQRAASNHIIDPSWLDESSSAAVGDELEQAYAYELGATIDQAVTPFLAGGLPTPVLRRVVRLEPSNEDFWDEIQQIFTDLGSSTPGADTRAVRHGVALYQALDHHPPAISAVVNPNAADAVDSYASAAGLTVPKLVNLLGPADLPFGDDDDGVPEVRAYARQVVARLAAAWPTATLREQVLASANQPEVSVVLDNLSAANIEFADLDLPATIEDEAHQAWTSLTSADRDVALVRISTMKQLQRVVPWAHLHVVSDVLESAIANPSARGIASMGREAFEDLLGPALVQRWQTDGVYVVPDTPVEEIEHKAKEIAGAIAIAATSAVDRDTLEKLRNDAERAPSDRFTLGAEAFTGESWCVCAPCESVFGPGAYLYDLLSFCEETSTLDRLTHHEGDVAAPRRADLLDLQLDCHTSHTPMPAIDLVIEQLEYRIASATGTPAALPTATTWPEEALRVAPEHTDNRGAAENQLQDATYPRPFPLDLPDMEIRLLLQREDVGRSSLIRRLAWLEMGSSTPDLDAAAAWFGWTTAERALIRGEAPIGEWYGLDDNWRQSVCSLPVFLDATGLDLEELRELLSCPTVNNRCVIWFDAPSAEDTCDVASYRITKNAIVRIVSELNGADVSVYMNTSGPILNDGVFMETSTPDTDPPQPNDPLTWEDYADDADPLTGIAVAGVAIGTDGVLELSNVIDDSYHVQIRVDGSEVVIDEEPREPFFLRVLRLLLVRRGLDCTLLEADHFIRACVSPEDAWDESTLRTLWAAGRLRDDLGISTSEVATLLGGWTTRGMFDADLGTPEDGYAGRLADGTYHDRFQNPARWEPHPSLALNANRKLDAVVAVDDNLRGAVLAGTRSNEETWAVMTGSDLWAEVDGGVTMEALTSLFRWSTIARALRTSVGTLRDIANLLDGQVPASDPAALLAWVSQARLVLQLDTTIDELAWMLRNDHHEVFSDADALTERIDALVDDITAAGAEIRESLTPPVSSPDIPTNDSAPWTTDTTLPAGLDWAFFEMFMSPLFSGQARRAANAQASDFITAVKSNNTAWMEASLQPLLPALDWLIGDPTTMAAELAGLDEEGQKQRLYELGMGWWLDHTLRSAAWTTPTWPTPPGAAAEHLSELFATSIDPSWFESANTTPDIAATTTLWLALRPTIQPTTVGWIAGHHDALVASWPTYIADLFAQLTARWLPTYDPENNLPVGADWADAATTLGSLATPLNQRKGLITAILCAHRWAAIAADHIGAWADMSAERSTRALTSWMPAVAEYTVTLPPDALSGYAIDDVALPLLDRNAGPVNPGWMRAQFARIRKFARLARILGLSDDDIDDLHSIDEPWLRVGNLEGASLADQSDAKTVTGDITLAEIAIAAKLVRIDRSLPVADGPDQRIVNLLDDVTSADVSHLSARLDDVALAPTSAYLGSFEQPEEDVTIVDRLNQAVEALGDIVAAVYDARRFGLQPAQLAHAAKLYSLDENATTGALATATNAATSVREAMRQAYVDDDAWSRVYIPIADQMRVARRDALLAWLTSNTADLNRVSLIHSAILADPLVQPPVQTSRMVAAHNAVQLFIQRLQLGLEDGIDSNGDPLRPRLSPSQTTRWTWMKQYRVWEAARRVLIHPENWVDPSLRIAASPLYKELQSALERPNLDEDDVAAAYQAYVDGVAEVARLEVMAFHQTEVPGSSTPEIRVVARTRSERPVFFYRKRGTDGSWQPWERIEAEIDSTNVAVTHFGGRTMIFWLSFPEGKEERAGVLPEVYLAQIERHREGWDRAAQTMYLFDYKESVFDVNDPVRWSEVILAAVPREDVAKPFAEVSALRLYNQPNVYTSSRVPVAANYGIVHTQWETAAKWFADAEKANVQRPTPTMWPYAYTPYRTVVSGNLVVRDPAFGLDRPRAPLRMLLSAVADREMFRWGTEQTGSFSLVFDSAHRTVTFGSNFFFVDSDNAYMATRNTPPYQFFLPPRAASQLAAVLDGYTLPQPKSLPTTTPPTSPPPLLFVDFEDNKDNADFIAEGWTIQDDPSFPLTTNDTTDPINGSYSCAMNFGNELQTPASLFNLTNFTVSFKIRLRAGDLWRNWPNSNSIVRCYDGADNFVRFTPTGTTGSSTMKVEVRNGGGFEHIGTTTTALQDGQVYELTLVVDGTGPTTVELHVDGIVEVSGTGSDATPRSCNIVNWQAGVNGGDILFFDDLQISSND